MIRCLRVLLTASCLTGCSGWPVGLSQLGQDTRQDGWPDQAGGVYDFGWHLSGDRAVAPLQVFDDGHRTWLQFQVGQPLPALFGVRDGTERLLPYRRLDPYVQIEGVWQGLVLRGGALTARAQYQGENRRSVRVGEAAIAGAGASTQMAGSASAPEAVQAMPLAPLSSPVAADAVATSTTSTQSGFRATPADANIRRALARWATSAQWTFEPEHWTPDVDIPLAGSADFPPDFRQAVRQLLAATELSERPLQPCFYSNRVLRVVPLAQACDRTARHAGAAS